MTYPPQLNKFKSLVHLLVGGNCVALSYAAYTGHEGFYRRVVMPCMRIVDAEVAHRAAVVCAKYGLVPRPREAVYPVLTTTVFGLSFANPIGVAAGFDKHGEAVDGLFTIGCGHVEVGSVTPLPQDGNPKPRVFRLAEDKAIINRYGFNSEGHEVVCDRIKAREVKTSGVLGINLGKNKTSPDAVKDYVLGVRCFGEHADYLVINISSPNTPGLRSMQGRELLQELVKAVVHERDQVPSRPPLLVKLAPDLTDQDKEDIAAVVRGSGVNGLVISNTTITRPDSLEGAHREETGGLSGAPVCKLATQTIHDMYRLTGGKLPIIGVGGVSSGQDAYDKIRAGASLVQVYSALVYEGPPLIARVKRELAALLCRDSYQSVEAAVGASHSDSFATPSSVILLK